MTTIALTALLLTLLSWSACRSLIATSHNSATSTTQNGKAPSCHNLQPIDAALLKSVVNLDLAGAQKAILQGANVNGCDGLGFSFLVNALATYDLEIVTYLINQGATMLLQGSGCTQAQPIDRNLLDAVEHKDLSTVSQLIIKGANINACDQDGFSVLVTAIASYEMEVVNLLLSHGAILSAS
ncbi:MAG: ankyrin repeat domain-containing protein [Myxococcota bacterium]|nr:ankyrin repeat domain-containing protein [Myxococcota bacterium]